MGLRIQWNDLSVDVPIEVEAAGGEAVDAYVATAMDVACLAAHGCDVADWIADGSGSTPPAPPAGPDPQTPE